MFALLGQLLQVLSQISSTGVPRDTRWVEHFAWDCFFSEELHNSW